ncbi:MAG: hypothetical protein IT305_17060 [Chloroflexi bacterium]|nr:hypothetical protein [Chloroflexota bacterium]
MRRRGLLPAQTCYAPGAPDLLRAGFQTRTGTARVWWYLATYFAGLILGVIANVWLDVRLRRPALSRQIVLAALGIVVGVVIYQWSTRPELWIMYGLWASTGVLAGLGSRESREPLG